MKSAIIKQLASGINPVLILKKKSQIYGNFLTSCHPNSPYPVVNDTRYHLDPGDKIMFNRFIPEGSDSWGTIDKFECSDSQGNTFFVFARNLKRFI